MLPKQYILAISGCFDEIRVCLFQSEKLIFEKNLAAKTASKLLVSIIEESLNQANIDLSKISLIMADSGPGAFTTLRVVIVTVNSIAGFLNIPVVGYNALEELANSAAISSVYKDSLIVPILNAYGKQLFYSFLDTSTNSFLETNVCGQVDVFFEKLKSIEYQKFAKIILTGDGVHVFEKEINAAEIPNLVITSQKTVNLPLQSMVNKQITNLALEDNNIIFKKELTPIYVKSGFSTKNSKT